MFDHLKPAARLLLLLTLLTGVLYPTLVTVLAQSLFPRQANGSLIQDAVGKALGSALIGQHFTAPEYFWSRPSATVRHPYDASASGGSNLGPSNPVLQHAVAARVRALQNADPGHTANMPVDLVTTSASGLDPHISLAAADYQIHRVASARHIDENTVRALVKQHSLPRQCLILGEPRVEVLALNLALDHSYPMAR